MKEHGGARVETRSRRLPRLPRCPSDPFRDVGAIIKLIVVILLVLFVFRCQSGSRPIPTIRVESYQILQQSLKDVAKYYPQAARAEFAEWAALIAYVSTREALKEGTDAVQIRMFAPHAGVHPDELLPRVRSELPAYRAQAKEIDPRGEGVKLAVDMMVGAWSRL